MSSIVYRRGWVGRGMSGNKCRVCGKACFNFNYCLNTVINISAFCNALLEYGSHQTVTILLLENNDSSFKNQMCAPVTSPTLRMIVSSMYEWSVNTYCYSMCCPSYLRGQGMYSVRPTRSAQLNALLISRGRCNQWRHL